MPEKPRILKQELIARTRLFRVEQLDLAFSNGNRRRYERVLGGDAGSVLIVPMLDADTVLLVREYAVGTQTYELGLPKGRVEAQEDPLQAANREIKEEIGYGAHRLSSIKNLTIAPGYVAHSTHIILAQDLYPDKREGDEPEPIEVMPWKLTRLEELIMREDVTEARSIAALYLARENLG